MVTEAFFKLSRLRVDIKKAPIAGSFFYRGVSNSIPVICQVSGIQHGVGDALCHSAASSSQ